MIHNVPKPTELKERLVFNLSKALWDSDLIGSRLALFLSEILWAVMLLWPGNTFDRSTYSIMQMITTEEILGCLFLLTAFCQISIVLWDNIHSIFARYFSVWNAVLWVSIVVSMLLAVQPPPAAIGGEIALAFVAVWIWIRPYILARGEGKNIKAIEKRDNNE